MVTNSTQSMGFEADTSLVGRGVERSLSGDGFTAESGNCPASRRATRAIQVGGVRIGGGAPVSVQSMTNTDTRDVAATLTQIGELAALGCEIIRVAVPDQRAAAALGPILDGSPLPVIADIHFDPRLALAAIAAGVAGLRINPGNITARTDLAAIAAAAGRKGVAVRIGVNSGSLEPELLERHGGATPQAMVDSAIRACAFFAEHGCRHLKVSLKTSRVDSTVAACRLFARQSDLPLHLGVTEAGTPRTGTVKSAVGIGSLLLDGIGDTIRVSLTASPAAEIPVAIAILEAAGCREASPEIVSCPSCGRCEVDLVGLAEAVEEEIARMKAAGWSFRGRKVAIMGCIVNGPGEARDASVGVAGGRGKGAIFRDGRIVKSVPEAELLGEFIGELRKVGTPPGRK